MLLQNSSMKKAALLSALAFSVSLTACTGGTPNATDTASPGLTGGTGSTTAPVASGGASVSLTGAGASFPAPLYQRWFADYYKQNPNIQTTYQSVGSGAGVEQFTKGTVDFGASDVGMKPEEIAKVAKGVVLLPMTAGSVVIAYNLPDVKGLKLTREVYADIFAGKIKSWDDAKIAAANTGAKLPKLPITIVHRSDGSGTTAVFTKHLSAISADWKKIGSGKTVNWPAGVGAKGNEGVTAQLQQTPGTIGYTEYGFAKQQNLSMAILENKAKKFVEPTPESGAKTLASVTLPADLQAFIVDPEGADSYPIVTYTWILAYKKYDDPKKAEALKKVIDWSLTEGQKTSSELGYIPLPAEVVTKVQAAAKTIQ